MNLKSISPKKSLGQNFLIDRNVARKTVGLIEISPQDTVLEIGPGTGALTSILLENNHKVIAVEIDQRAIDELKKKFPRSEFPNFHLIHKDFKHFDFRDLKDFGYDSDQSELKVIGNIPYYLSSEILFKLFESDISISCAVMTIQKELALRLVAKTGTKDYGILTLALNMKADCKIEFDISPQCFYPVPNVWSSVIKIDFKHKDHSTKDYRAIMNIIRQAFNQRRKMLNNTLKSEFQKIDEKKLNPVDFERYLRLKKERPEQLIVDDFVFLHKLFHGKTNLELI